MKLRLYGHTYKYALEQIMLTLFPDERPEYPSEALLIGKVAEDSATENTAAEDSTAENIDAERFIAKDTAAENTSTKYTATEDNSAKGAPSDLHGYAANSQGYIADSRLTSGSVFAQATTIIRKGKTSSKGIARVRRDKLTDKLVTDRLLQRIVKQSFYKAAAAYIDSPPVWGSLTGIRPAQLVYEPLALGVDDLSAKRLLMNEYHVSPKRAQLCVETARCALRMKHDIEPGSVALYIGIPFCPSRCAYCSFVSNSVEKSHGLIQPFVETLLTEIREMSELLDSLGLSIASLYIGGGTPTSLPAESLESILTTLNASFDLTHLQEYTLEAGRPETITAEKLQIMSISGVRRVCVNPQSMSQDVLLAIGRSHSPDDVLRAVDMVRDFGFALNMDLIAGLPGDDPEGFENSLDTVMSLNPENITVHTLSLKKGSRIMLENTPIPTGAQVGEMLDYADFRLRSLKYSPYYLYRQKFTSGGFENIGWCLPGHESMYNISMMEELCTVIGLGGGAVTKLVAPDGRIQRIFNAKYPREYIMQSDGLHTAAKSDKINSFYKVHRTSPHTPQQQ